MMHAACARRLLYQTLLAWLCIQQSAKATPANKAAMERHFDAFLGAGLKQCTTCHLPSPLKNPERLADFPHNPFGDRLRALGAELEKAGQGKKVEVRLAMVATEDSDGDGIDNEGELLAGTNPGDAAQMPQGEHAASLPAQRNAFQQWLSSYRWQPFERIQRPSIPPVQNRDWVRTPVDAFIAAEHERRGLKPRPQASRATLLRRVYLDLIGLTPTPDEQLAFENDHASDAYEKVVDRLLNDPAYGERWGRHWMDIWRYSDWAGWTDGKQVRDSQRHIWRWRDWIVESLNADKGYDNMIVEMLAADEASPEDSGALRATGFLVRNYKMLSREQWLEDTVKHTAQGFLGVTVGCAKCHDHVFDPVSQADYYQFRAIFEPHQVRIDRIAGETDIEKDGLPRAYDADGEAPTWFFDRGDERKPDKNRPMKAAVPAGLCGDRLKPALDIAPVKLPRDAVFPDRRTFVINDLMAISRQKAAAARAELENLRALPPAKPGLIATHELVAAIADQRHACLLAEIEAEKFEEAKTKTSDEWRAAAQEVSSKQRALAVLEATLERLPLEAAANEAQRRLDAAKLPTESSPSPEAKAAAEKATTELAAARKKLNEADEKLKKANESAAAAPSTEFKARAAGSFAAVSTGRRFAFARWVASADNPLTARVAMNHLWLRHFGAGIVATPENFGASGARPSHPALLDWLAAEFIAGGWRMKALHRMLVTSSTYRMASTPDEDNSRIDRDNAYLWRMPSRRMEAELVRDNILYVSGTLDRTMGGPEIDHSKGLVSRRRSLYLRSAVEKEVEFLKIFNGPEVSECYQRRTSVMPQQALALANSELPASQAKVLTKLLGDAAGTDDGRFVREAFVRILAHPPTSDEALACGEFLVSRNSTAGPALAVVTAPAPQSVPAQSPPESNARARENLILILFNHHDFITIR